MVAQLRPSPAPDAPALRVVPVMADEPPSELLGPGERVTNTIRCQTEFCGLPLCLVTNRGNLFPQHALPLIGRDGHTTYALCLCPNCKKPRKVTLR